MKPYGKRCIVSMPWSMLVLVLLGLSLWTNAFAREAAVPRACAGDLNKFCKDVTPGGGRIASCLKEHAGDLSSACKADIEDMGKKIKAARNACRDDADKHCKGIIPGGGRIIKCMKAHENELSPACKEKIARARKK